MFPGRRNELGTPVIYAAQTSSLCALEVLAGARELASDYVLVEIEIPDQVSIHEAPVSDLPAEWNADVIGEATRRLGAEWVAAGATAILSVPPSVNPHERNFLLNPAHPDFHRLAFRPPQPFSFSDRLKRRP